MKDAARNDQIRLREPVSVIIASPILFAFVEQWFAAQRLLVGTHARSVDASQALRRILRVSTLTVLEAKASQCEDGMDQLS